MDKRTNDDQFFAENLEIVSVETDTGYPIKFYDDCYFGGFWVYRNLYGVDGIVRAQSWDEAYEAVLDEFLTPIELREVPEAYGFDSKAEFEAAIERRESPELVDGYEYQPNPTPGTSGIVAPDYIDRLDALSAYDIKELGIIIKLRKA